MAVEVVVESGNGSRQKRAVDERHVKFAPVSTDLKGQAEVEVIPTDPSSDEADEVVVETTPEGRWIVRWWKSRVSGPFMVIIQRGTEPKQLAWSAALGVTLGVFPIYGVTVFLCGLAILILRSNCHAPTLLLTNFVATPLELALLIPFLRLGEWMTNGGHIMLSSSALWEAVTGRATKDVLLSILHALVGWLIAAPLLLAALYIVFLPFFTCMIRKYGAKADPELQIGLLDDDEFVDLEDNADLNTKHDDSMRRWS